ncbi:hypothetical protein [Methylobrevis albus]|uniref:Uncharacterized protein n=1 Tax=Methylobrevis albus TaxID=2793297 RepID=A0A931HYT7_9HYPH|nr:hypothetical protein [Methylobrevis albus]MBH0236850.1 hypothetical protein [Methylobrevis albus]
MKFFARTCAALLIAIGLVAPAAAQSDLGRRNVTVMVFSDDADVDTIPRDNRIFNRVITQLQETMNLRGFQVFDETSTTMGFTDVNRTRRTDAEFLEISRSVTPRINVAVIFQIYASVVRSEHANILRPKVRIAGRMLNVHSGQFIGAFEVAEFPLQPLPRSCTDSECLLETIGAEARMIANALGETLADKLEGFVVADEAAGAEGTAVAATAAAAPAPDCAGMPDTFVLRFREFDDDQINQFEPIMSKFGCYTGHATLRSMRGLVEYTYNTSSGDGRMSRNLRLLLDYLGTKGTVAQTGNVFDVTQIRTR